MPTNGICSCVSAARRERAVLCSPILLGAGGHD
nr:MAG TPA: hypothetical protein [Caudoviricetes sp.]